MGQAKVVKKQGKQSNSSWPRSKVDLSLPTKPPGEGEKHYNALDNEPECFG